MDDKKEQQKENLPSLSEALQTLITQGTVVQYPEKPIIFKESHHTAVKTLEVNICSTEGDIKALLHKLHSKTRSI